VRKKRLGILQKKDPDLSKKRAKKEQMLKDLVEKRAKKTAPSYWSCGSLCRGED